MVHNGLIMTLAWNICSLMENISTCSRGVNKDLTYPFYNVELTQIANHFCRTSFLCTARCSVKYSSFPILFWNIECVEYWVQRRSAFWPHADLFSVLVPLPRQEVSHSFNILGYTYCQDFVEWDRITGYSTSAGGPHSSYLIFTFCSPLQVTIY